MKRDAALSVVLGLACLAAWEAAVRVGHTSPLVLPAPSVVAQSLWQGLNSGYLWPHIVHTLTEVVLGPWRDEALAAWVNDGDMDGSLLGMDYLGKFHLELAADRLLLRR